jgi:hypothetical protein
VITCFTHLSRSKQKTYKFSTITCSYVSRPMKSRDQPCMIMYPTRHTSLLYVPIRAEGQWRLGATSPANAHSRTHCKASKQSLYHVPCILASNAMAGSDSRFVLGTSSRRTSARSDCPFRQPRRIILDKFHLQSGDMYRAEIASTLSCSVAAVYPPCLMPDYSLLSCTNP